MDKGDHAVPTLAELATEFASDQPGGAGHQDAQRGPLVLSNILHFTVGIWVMSGRADVKSVLGSPLVWSTLLGLAFSSFRLQLPAWLDLTLTMIGNILVRFQTDKMGLGRSATIRPRACWQLLCNAASHTAP